ncbi:MAG: nitrilase-related carbon-nitrogen hydrolase, partial [Pseudomonadota bacterium]
MFPEAFLPGYPLWAWFIPAGHTHPLRELYAELHANSVTVPGAAVARLAETARAVGVAVAMGMSERNVEASDGSLFNTLLLIGPDGRVLGKHRKLVPTAGERLIWAQGDGSDLAVWPLDFARVGGLICWENRMPLARYAIYRQGPQIWAAPTADDSDGWIAHMRAI